MKKIFLTMTCLLTGLFFVSALEASVTEIPFQGFLMDGESAVEGEQSLTFTFTDCESGDSLWTEDQTVTFTEGSFAVQLGSVESFPEDLTDFDLCLGMTLNGETLSTEISAVPQAMYAARAGEADYAMVAGTLASSGEPISAENTWTGTQTFSSISLGSSGTMVMGTTGTVSANGTTVSASELSLLDGKTSLVDTDDTGVITPTHLSAGNSPTDEYCLTYEGSATGFEWQSCSTSSIADDSLDFDKMKSSMTLDESTTVSINGASSSLTFMNTGTGTKDLLVLDAAAGSDASLVFRDSDLSLYGWSTYNIPATANMVLSSGDGTSKGGGSLLSFSKSDATGGLDLTAIVNDATATSFGVSVNALTQTDATTVTTFPAGAQVFGVYDTLDGSPLLAVKAGTGTLALRNNETIDNDTDGTIALTGNVLVKNEASLKLGDADSSNYVGFKSPTVVGTNVVWTLPSADATSAGQVLTSSAGGTLSWATVDTSAADDAPTTATYITQTADGTLSGEFALSTLTTGLLKVTNGTGVLSTATATDYYAPGGADIAVADGGTGASTLTSNGVLYGNGTSAIGATAAGTSGQLLLGNTSAVPAFATMTGDATISAGGYLTIGPDTVALSTDTSGFYAAGDAEAGNATGVACTGCIDFGDISDTPTLDADTTIETSYDKDLILNSTLTSVRTSPVLSVTQANGASTGPGNLVSMTQSDQDTGAGNVLYLSQASNKASSVGITVMHTGAVDSAGTGYGGWFQVGASNSSTGADYKGVYSYAYGTPSSGSLSNYGVYSRAAGSPSSNTVTNYGVYGLANGTDGGSAVLTNYGVYGSATGSDTNIGGYFTASGGAFNYAGIFANGMVGIGESAPSALLHVGGALYLGGDGSTETAGSLTFYDGDSADAPESVAIIPNNVGTSYTIKLPTDVGIANQVLTISSVASQVATMGWTTPTTGITAVGTCASGNCFTESDTASYSLYFEGSSADGIENIITTDNPTGGDGTFVLPNTGLATNYFAVDTTSVTNIDGTGLGISSGSLQLASTEVSDTTWGSGSGFTWSFDAGVTDPTIQFASNSMTFNTNATLTKADPAVVFNVTTATDTDFWAGAIDDGGGDDDDYYQIGDGTTPGTNPFFTMDTNGNVGIGATPSNLLTVTATSAPTTDVVGISNSTTTTTDGVDGLGITFQTAASGTNGAQMSGLNINATFNGTDNDDIYRGGNITVTNEGSGSLATVIGLKVQSGNSSANAAPVDTLISLVGNDTGNTTSTGLYVLSNAGTMTSGVEIDNLSAGTTMSDAIKIGSGVSSQTITRGINIATTAVATDLTLQNSETIDNDTDGVVTVTGALKVTNGAHYETITTAGSDPYTVVSTDYIIHSTKSASGTQTINLPAAATNSGRILVIKDAGGGASTYNITIDGNAAETIDGATTFVMTGNYQSVTLYCNGSAWFVM